MENLKPQLVLIVLLKLDRLWSGWMEKSSNQNHLKPVLLSPLKDETIKNIFMKSKNYIGENEIRLGKMR